MNTLDMSDPNGDSKKPTPQEEVGGNQVVTINVEYTLESFRTKFWKAPHGWVRTTWRDIDGFIVKVNGSSI